MKLKELEKNEIVIYTPGSDVPSTIDAFAKKAREALAGINKKLESDEDFVIAKDDSKLCGLYEVRIANAKQEALQKMTDYFNQATTADKLSDEFRSMRLLLDKLVKTEEARRKNEIIQSGFDKANNVLSSSIVKHGYSLGRRDFENVIKGMRSRKNMEDAVDALAGEHIENIKNLETDYSSNLAAMEKAEVDMPGIFPDKKSVALKNVDIVALEITARVETQKRKLREAEERAAAEKKAREEREEAQRKATEERERLAKERIDSVMSETADKIVETLNTDLIDDIRKQAKDTTFGGFDFSPEEISADPFSGEWTPPPIKKKYRLIIDLETTDIASMDYKIRQLLGFQEVLNVDIEDIFLR